MGIIDTTKELVGLIQKADNMELLRQVVQLQTQVYELFEENRALKEKLVTREKLVFRSNRYFIESDSYCSRCWDGAGKLVRLHTQNSGGDRCPECKTFVANDDGRSPSWG